MRVRTLGIILFAVGFLMFLYEMDLLSMGLIWVLGGVAASIVHLRFASYPGLLVFGCGALAWGVHLYISQYYAPQMHRPMLFLLFGLGAALAYLTEVMLGSSVRWLLWGSLVLFMFAGIEFFHVMFYHPFPDGFTRYWPVVLIALGLWLIIGVNQRAAGG